MTDEEADRVALVLSKVDGGCSTCAKEAAEMLAELLPDRPWLHIVSAKLKEHWNA